MSWSIKPLKGKYYGTEIVHSTSGTTFTVWLPRGHVPDYRVSDRELEEGWDEDCGYDHTEMQHTYEAACVIVKALNEAEA